MPDDPPFYHAAHTQALVLDVLFIWCKLHPQPGGYRQGMHELLAPIVLVLEQDALARIDAADDDDPVMLEMLDAEYVEHDAYALFERLMLAAASFYRLDDDDDGHQSDMGARPGRPAFIVEKSRSIHERSLRLVDPELADHFNAIEILPQVFLMQV